MEKINITKRPEIHFGTEFKNDMSSLLEKSVLWGSKVVLITGKKSFQGTVEYQTLKQLLLEKIDAELIDEAHVESNPTWEEIVRFGENKDNIDTILCVGGGSVIDFGKALKLHFYKNAQIFAVYTLPGSASIVTPFVIFNNDEFKIGEHSEDIIPDYVYINKKIILSVPADLLKFGTFDILAHTIESFVSKASTNQSRIYALKAITFLSEYLRSGSSNVLSLIKADIFAGMSEQVGLVLFPHAAGHYLTYRYRIPHSLATMYFLKNFVDRLQSAGLVIPEEMLKLLAILNTVFLDDFKKPISLTLKDIELSISMSEKYMPFIFSNNPILLIKEDYLTLYDAYENPK